MNGRTRMTGFSRRVSALEQKLAAKRASAAKKATDDMDIQGWSEELTSEEEAIVSKDDNLDEQIKALEAQIKASDEDEEEMEASGDDDEEEVEAAVEEEVKEEPVAKKASVRPVAKAAPKKAEDEKVEEEVKAADEDEEEVKASDEDEEVIEASDDEDELLAAEIEEMDKMLAGDDEDEEEVEASEETPGIEDEISDTNDQVSVVFDPNAPGEQPIDVAKTASSKKRYASIIKEATARLDRVASYLEKSGKKQLAYRLDKVSDALEAKLK